MVDPWREHAGADEAERLIKAGARGFKFHPPSQGFYANDQRMYALYEVIAAARLPALFHTGQTAVGQGAGAGGGIRLKYGNPIYLDDVAVDFPDMPIIMAHPSFPWQEEALAIAMHKAQVYIDLSGWSPKYFPPQLVQYANTLIKNKVLFGSDHPMITTDRWLSDFQNAGFREEVQPLILKENAAQLLGLNR
jgi:predicted TIM-barrel fold metal-dependent hydrolase